MRRRSSSASSSSRSAREDGNQPSTAQMMNTASHSRPLELWAVLRISASSTRFFFSGRRRHTRSGSAFLLNRSSDLSHFVHGRDSLVDILKERGLLSESDA